MRNILFTIIVCIMVITGCSVQNTQSSAFDEGELTEKVASLEEHINDYEEELQELRGLVDTHKAMYTEQANMTRIELTQLKHLINHLPNITHRQGYLDLISNETATIQLAYKIESDEAPNGFMIEEGEQEVKNVSEDVMIYILEGTQLKSLDSVNALSETLKDHQRLFDLYFLQGELLLVSEVYLP
ncbi:hypothetical protein [Caldalkalibacillus salinus]|uniref:hypothetical protein n=1 Tax=Caldalkalibacillus salinus TaxID=2803787 RepID=UPI0019250540|nr:hypothetical protein [Caldalkalibacillus salinus]